MTWVAVAAIVVAGAGGAYASSEGAKKQANAAGAASGASLSQYQDTAKNLYPWLNRGQYASGQLQNDLFGANPTLGQPFTLDKFQQSPSYQFNLQQGQQAIDKAANARGNLYAPQTLQDLSKFSQGMAGNDFNNAFNQYMAQQGQQFNMLNTISGSGQNAAAQMGGFGAGAVGQSGQYLTSGAAAQAGGMMGVANSLGGMGLGLAGYGSYLQGQQAPTYSGAGGGMYGGIPLSDLSQYYGYSGGGAIPIGL